MSRKSKAILEFGVLKEATVNTFKKLNPLSQIKNPVMFIVFLGALFTTWIFAKDLYHGIYSSFNLQIGLWLWFTVLFANFAEAIAEGRGKARTDSLKKTRSNIVAKKLVDGKVIPVPRTPLKIGDSVLCEPGDLIPGDGEVIEGIASVGESAITGESAPVVRESGGDRSAGDIDILLLDKTGTITLGNREARTFFPAKGVEKKYLADVAQLSSLADETPEGRSIVVLAKKEFGIRERNLTEMEAEFIPFSAYTKMSGLNLKKEGVVTRRIRKGAGDAIKTYLHNFSQKISPEMEEVIQRVSQKGNTPILVAEDDKLLGVIELKGIVKGGLKERFVSLRKMGIRTVMITGDNQLTAAAIAAEAGVDDFLAEATPATKLKKIREQQSKGYLVAMIGDGQTTLQRSLNRMWVLR